MRCCENTSVVITNEHTMVCTNCGIERPVLVNSPDYNTYITTGPLMRSYSRPERWNTLVKKVCGLHCGPPMVDPVWEYLKGRAPYNSSKEIIKTLRKSKLKNKHYPSLHAFCRVFDSSYVEPFKPRIVLKNLCGYFDHIMTMWNHTKNEQFFSYSWLIEQGLEIFNHITYLPFVKKLMCPNRRAKYTQTLLTLYETHVETHRHGSQDSRLRYVRLSSLSHHSPPQNLWPAPCPVEQNFVRVGSVRLPLGLVRKHLKSPGDLGKT